MDTTSIQQKSLTNAGWAEVDTIDQAFPVGTPVRVVTVAGESACVMAAGGEKLGTSAYISIWCLHADYELDWEDA